ncbi:hypothetical protein ARMGADRAFT_1031951 [Armillaria gallica]|uniref:Uncharacterized protein n=1 Tax=Armillaria gallica TaxID=47427 RepID=A0A2H3DKA3_ARMGA|nr:hypothetical protein ARMGADRAFT_1031951 [Armillaria gallica]
MELWFVYLRRAGNVDPHRIAVLMPISMCTNTIMVWLAAQPVFNISKSRPIIAHRELHALIVYFGLTTQTIVNLRSKGFLEKLGFENDLTKAIRDSIQFLLKFGFLLALEAQFTREKRGASRQLSGRGHGNSTNRCSVSMSAAELRGRSLARRHSVHA